MTFAFRCPKCGGTHKVADEMAGKQARCKCGVLLSIPQRPQPATAASAERSMPNANAPQGAPSTGAAPRATCSGCGKVRLVTASMVGQKIRCPCGTVFRAAASPAAEPVSPVHVEPVDTRSASAAFGATTSGPTSPNSSIFDDVTEDDWNADYALQPSEEAVQEPRPSDREVLSQYTNKSRIAGSPPSDEGGGGFFGAEKKGLDYGIVGGLAMMAIAVVWFFGGLAAGFIFFYPPILFIIGLIGLLKGLFTGNVAGS